MKNNDILRLAASACVMLCLPLHVFGQGMGVAWDVLTKDDTPEYLDAYDQWFGVDKPTSFRLALRYYGITSVRPASLSYPLPVDDNSISASVKMMRYDSSDGDFEFWLSAPSRDSADPGYMPFHDEMPAQRLYYDWNDLGRYLTLKPDTSVSLQPAYGHRLFMKADNAGDVLTWHVSHARTMFNADTVCLYDMPRKRLEGMRKANRVDSRFTHCKDRRHQIPYPYRSVLRLPGCICVYHHHIISCVYCHGFLVRRKILRLYMATAVNHP